MTLFHQWILRGNIIPGYLNQSCIVNSKLYHSPPEELQIPCQYYHISFLFLGIPPFDIYFLLADFLLVTNCPVLPHGLHLRIRWAHQNLQCLSAAPPSEWWRKDAHKAQCFAPLSETEETSQMVSFYTLLSCPEVPKQKGDKQHCGEATWGNKWTNPSCLLNQKHNQIMVDEVQ